MKGSSLQTQMSINPTLEHLLPLISVKGVLSSGHSTFSGPQFMTAAVLKISFMAPFQVNTYKIIMAALKCDIMLENEHYFSHFFVVLKFWHFLRCQFDVLAFAFTPNRSLFCKEPTDFLWLFVSKGSKGENVYWDLHSDCNQQTSVCEKQKSSKVGWILSSGSYAMADVKLISGKTP